MQGQRGFTLLELLIVCLLILVSLSFSLPSLRSSLTTDELGSGSRKLISLITSARSRAVRDSRPQLVLFGLSDNKVWYQDAEDGAEKKNEKDNQEKEEDGGDDREPKVHGQVTLADNLTIAEIVQAGGAEDNNPLRDGLWISKQGYMDRTYVRLSRYDEDLYLVIMPFFFDIQVRKEFAGFE